MIGTSSHSQQEQHQQSNRQLHSQQQQQHHHTQHQHLVNHRTSSANQQHDADDDYQDENGMRVGQNYQAEIPQFIAYSPAPEYYEDEKAIRVWSPYNKIPDHVLDEFINKAKDKFFYNTEQALGMLSWHKFDLNRAYADLPNFVPYPNEWSVEDKVLFEQAYQFHEKQFNKIKQMLPDKSMANLINYYYTWKKTRTRASLMERQTRRFAARRAAGSNGPSDEEDMGDGEQDSQQDHDLDADGREVGENGESVGLENGKKVNEAAEEEDEQIVCALCQKELLREGKPSDVIVDGVVDDADLCPPCYLKFLKAGKKIINPDSQLGDCFYHPEGEPKRMLFYYQDVMSLVEGPPEAGDFMLKQLDAQVQGAKRDIQTKKQTLSQINEKIQPIAEQLADLNMTEFADILPEYKPTKNFSPDEIQLVIQGIRRYGTDFNAISDVIRSKSPDTIRTFYVHQKERLNLGTLVNEFERNLTAQQINPPTDQTPGWAKDRNGSGEQK